MNKARLLPAGRSTVAIASMILTFSLTTSSAGAVEILAGPQITTNPQYEAQQVALAQEVSTLSSGGDGGSWEFKRREKCFMRRINRIRKRHGMNRLRWDKHLGVVGRKHAYRLAKAGTIWHDDIGRKVTRWRSLGQNTGMGGGCRRLTRAFMHSSGHRANYLGRWRHVGVGVVRRKGTVYVQQVFERRRDPGNVWHKP